MTALLEARNLFKRFGGLAAVKHLSLHVDPGEALGLIGPNGAGKTTIFNLIMDELKPDSGEILFRDVDITRKPTHERVKQGIVRTYQVPRPFADMTVAANIRVGMMPDDLGSMMRHGPDLAREREIGLSVGFGDRELAMYPGELSMGDLRRLELARNLAADPKLLLLDEVFAGLTVAEIGQISDLLVAHKKQGLTYIIVSHDLRSLAPLVDRVIAISFGETIAEGSFSEVIENEAVQKAYLGN